MCPSETGCSLDCICVGSAHMRVACNGGCPNYRTDAAHVTPEYTSHQGAPLRPWRIDAPPLQTLLPVPR